MIRVGDQHRLYSKINFKKGVRTMDKIIFGIACLTLTVVFGIAIYGAALNSSI